MFKNPIKKMEMQRGYKLGTNLHTHQIKIAFRHFPGKRSKNRAWVRGHVLSGVFLVGLMHGKENGLIDVDV